MGFWTEGGGKTAGVLGMGLSGRAAARLLRASGFEVTGIDSGDQVQPCEWCGRMVTGASDPAVLEGLDCLVLSPGVRPSSPIPEAARDRGIPVTGEIELAGLHSRAPVLAVTGSNGKTTTVEWLGYVLGKAGRRTVVAGNVGFPFCDAVLDHPDPEFFVVEVSSYQLETVETFHPAAAVILNVTPDHLERHGSMEGYLRAKAAVFGNQDGGDTCVLNAEDEFLMTLSGSLGGREMLFSRTREVGCGAFAAGGDIILAPGGDPVRVVGTDELSLRGRHNLSNALAVICMASAAGLRPWEMVAGLRSFAGVPHRIESVAVHDGVEYVNDSKSTNVDSLRVALESFSKPVVLLAGGQAKDTDYSVLRTLVTCMTSRVVLFGRDAGRLLDAWKGSVPITVTSGLEEALATAVRDAVAGDVILLSPGCASFDQYRNFEERGEHFRRLVEALP